ncbi:Coenzyme F420 hydrogenase/dehydrogenase, beta subunit C-terminal domain [Parabacteroides distasonis]|nr:Coenzyme F420 hydrogenase/dehydrogenase, beta subunit C-terminal domain [Parabacteroides distasonis]
MSHPNIKERDARIESISFRDKRLGWKKYSFALTLSVPIGHGAKNTVLLSEPLNKNIFLRGFLADLYLRPSCHACPAKNFKSGSDVTIGDFWGIQNVMPEMDDDRG